MKQRIIAVILTLCLIVSVFSTSAFANDTTKTCLTVYLDTSAATDGDGSSASPFNSLASAVTAIDGSTDDKGCIVVAGTLTVSENIPSHTKEITFTGEGATFHYTKNILLGGPTVFEDISLCAGVAGNTWVFLGTAGYPLTCGEGVTKSSASYSLNIDAGADVSGKDINLTLLGGSYGSIYVGSTSASDITVRNANINISGNAALSNLILGANASGGVTFTGDLNLTIGAEVGNMYYTTKGKTPVFEGAVTLLYNNGMYRLYEISETLTAKEGVYVMSCEKGASYLEITDTRGVFKVVGDNEAVAVSSVGEMLESVSKELALNSYGKYSVTFPDSDIEYLNGGKEIKVKKDTNLNFAELTYFDPEGKLFVGWTDKNGKAVSSGEFKTGDILYAKYVDFAESDFCIKGTELRAVSDSVDKQGLRIIFEKNRKFEAALKSAVGSVSFGAIYMPTNYSGGTDMEISSAHVVDRSITPSYSPKKVAAANIYARSSTAEQYTLCITDSIEQLTKDKYYKFYTVKGYAEYTDINGVARVLYTDYLTTSLYKTALAEKEALGDEAGALCNTIITYVEGQRIIDKTTGNGGFAFSAWLTGPNAPDSQTDRDPNHAAYLLKNNMLVRDIVIGDSSQGGTPIEIAAFSDIHFNYYNKMDTLLNNPSVNAQWFGVEVTDKDGKTSVVSRDMGRVDKGFGSVANSAKLMEFGSFYDKTVVIGDIMDYFSYGTAELSKKLLIDRSINNNLLIALGNHETAELFAKVSKANGFREMFTQNYKYQKLNSDFWPNDIYYHSEVITKGDKQVKIVVMDNQAVKYQDNSNIYNRLSADIADCKQSGVPILIFQHVPMNTYNEAYPKFVPFNTGYGAAMPDSEAGAMGENNYYIKRGSDAKGPSENYTAKVFDLIASNPEVIKGIFCGHVHNNFYSEILATTYDASAKKYVTKYAEDGVTPLTIPQYIVGGSYMGGVAGASVLKISVY